MEDTKTMRTQKVEVNKRGENGEGNVSIGFTDYSHLETVEEVKASKEFASFDTEGLRKKINAARAAKARQSHRNTHDRSLSVDRAMKHDPVLAALIADYQKNQVVGDNDTDSSADTESDVS